MKEKDYDMELQAWMIRILAGGLAGTLFFFCLGGFFNAISGEDLVFLPGSSLPFQAVSSTLAAATGSAFLAGLIQYGLYFALGAGIGVATLPFAEDGKELLIRSLLHFAYSAAISSALLWLSGWNRGSFVIWLAELGILVLLYLLIWFGRWLSWWFELDAIRERLGLAPPVSPLKVRETLPHLGFAALLCLAVPALLLGLLHLFHAPAMDRCGPASWCLPWQPSAVWYRASPWDGGTASVPSIPSPSVFSFSPPLPSSMMLVPCLFPVPASPRSSPSPVT